MRWEITMGSDGGCVEYLTWLTAAGGQSCVVVDQMFARRDEASSALITSCFARCPAFGPRGGHCRGCWLNCGSMDDTLPHRACSGRTAGPWPGPSPWQKGRPSRLIGIFSSEEKVGFC